MRGSFNGLWKARAKRVLPSWIFKGIRRVLHGPQIDEAEIVARYFASKAQSTGVMVDVGAHYGNSLLPFARRGFRVLAFEPDRRNRDRLVELVKQLPNVQVDARAVSESDATEVPFFSSDVSTGISGLAAFHQSHKETDRIESVRLDTFCQQQDISKIDFLKIDTEGHDLFVLRSLDLSKMSPEVILCEFEDRKTTPLGYNFRDLTSYLTEHGYKLLISEWYPIVEYGRSHRWRRFVVEPDLVVEPLAWGNVIAVRSENWKGLQEATSLFGAIEGGGCP